MLEDGYPTDLTIRQSELPKYLEKYNKRTQEELDKYLWFECGIALKVVES